MAKKKAEKVVDLMAALKASLRGADPVAASVSAPIPAEEGGRAPTDAELEVMGYLVPKAGTRLPSRNEVANLLQHIVENAIENSGEVDQPLVEQFAQFLDAIYAKLDGAPASVVSSEEGGRAETDFARSMDAQVWAREFMARFGNRKDEIDEADMLAWFANAIMAGFDEAESRHRRAASVVGDASEGMKLRALDEYDATVAERHADEAGGWEKIRERNERHAKYLIDLSAADEDDIKPLEDVATFGVIWLRDALASLRSTRAALEEARAAIRAHLAECVPCENEHCGAADCASRRALRSAIPSQESEKV